MTALQNRAVELQNRAIDTIMQLSEDKLWHAMSYLGVLKDQPDDDDPYTTPGATPPDDFDMELCRLADEAILAGDFETFSFDEVLKGAGLTYEDIRNP